MYVETPVCSTPRHRGGPTSRYEARYETTGDVGWLPSPPSRRLPTDEDARPRDASSDEGTAWLQTKIPASSYATQSTGTCMFGLNLWFG